MIFNNAIKKILQMLLSKIDMETGSDCRKMSYCDNVQRLFQKKKIPINLLK